MVHTTGYFHLHLISDATGETLITVARAAAAQYARVMPVEHVHPLVRTQKQLDRGARLVELLKQPQYRPMTLEQQVMVIYAGTKGYIDDIPLARVQEFQNAFLKYVDTSAPQLRSTLAEKKELSDDLEKQLKTTLDEFKARSWQK